MGGYLKKSSLGQQLMELVCFRVSQVNGCAYCLDMHAKDLRAKGETEQRLYGLSAWRETPYYSDKEKAALAWAEAVNSCHVPDDVYGRVKEQFTDEEIIDLTFVITNINTWNRLNIAFATVPGDYRPGQYA